VLRTTPEKREERERVRTALLRAALALAATGGFGSLGLREVSRAAGIAPTSFYRHFSDMEELGLAVIELLGAAMLERVTRRTEDAAKQQHDVSQALLDAFQDELGADPELLRFVVSEHVGALAPLRTALRRHFATLAERLRAAANSGHPGHETPGWAADAVVVLVLDALDRAHSAGQEARDSELQRSLPALRALLGASQKAGSGVDDEGTG
jgi:AcrR family transcriptional regulator